MMRDYIPLDKGERYLVSPGLAVSFTKSFNLIRAV